MITEKQVNLIGQYIKDPSNDVDTLLLQLDDKITEIGFNDNYSLNEVGIVLQNLYDDILNQN